MTGSAVAAQRFATQVGAADKKYSDKACKDISDTVDFLLGLTPEMWKGLEKNLEDKEKALKIRGLST